MIPNEEKLGSDYLTSVAYEQYQRRLALMKNIRGKNQDVHNYWHHYGDFNWDYPNRWWAQIAGDCVDLNTENDYVADYLVKCYGSFIQDGQLVPYRYIRSYLTFDILQAVLFLSLQLLVRSIRTSD